MRIASSPSPRLGTFHSAACSRRVQRVLPDGSMPARVARIELGGARDGSAVAAGAAEDDVMAGDGVAGSALDLVQRPLELVVGERFDLAAVVADEVVMVLSVRVDRLEAGRAGADVDPLDEAVACSAARARGRRSRSRRGGLRPAAGRRSPGRSGSNPGGRAARRPRGGRRRFGGPSPAGRRASRRPKNWSAGSSR